MKREPRVKYQSLRHAIMTQAEQCYQCPHSLAIACGTDTNGKPIISRQQLSDWFAGRLKRGLNSGAVDALLRVLSLEIVST